MDTGAPVSTDAGLIGTVVIDDGGAALSDTGMASQYPSSDGTRYVAMISPNAGESFVSPATLRLMAAARDPNVDTNSPAEGLGGNASKVQFFVDDNAVLEVDGANAEYWVFKGFASGITTGSHQVWARGIYTKPDEVLDSVPVTITVADPPAYAQTVDLTQNVTIADQDYVLAGAADKRVRLNGHGFSIGAAAGATGGLSLRYVDVFDLGIETDTSQPAIDVTTPGSITIEDSTFDTTNTVHIAPQGTATASVQRNLFRSNMRMPLGQNPDGEAPGSFPVFAVSGTSTAPKVFAGNNIGAGWVELDSVQQWTVGGSTDADSNVLIGPRVGFHVLMSSAVEVERNYSHHVYFGGWSQGNDFELEGSPAITVEHNVIYGSSWPVRGAGCEFRYNLVLDAGHQWLWVEPNGSIHHNLFIGGDNDVGGIYVLYSPPNVQVFNNTFDGQLSKLMKTAVDLTNGSLSLTSNLFMNVPVAPTVLISGGTLAADYNMFSNPQTTNYSDGRMPAHDVSAADPMLAAVPKTLFDVDEASIWTRTTNVAGILSLYRSRYSPKPGSPVIDVGDPSGGAGNDIGAIGAGVPNAADKFGMP
jgi:hypothetical protein